MALAPQALEDAATGAISVRAIERIVVRAPNWLGDAVLSLPAVRDVRRNFPGARMGERLQDTLRPFELKYPACYTCHAQGLSCRT